MTDLATGAALGALAVILFEAVIIGAALLIGRRAIERSLWR
ncbi:hypothetical protein [Phenylobacterium sp.]